MGGLNTEVAAETTDVLLEAAVFDPLSIRRTSRKLALMSESNYRFERGIDTAAVDAASLRACELICQLGGGTLADGIVDVWAKPPTPSVVALRPQRCNSLLGINVPAGRRVRHARRHPRHARRNYPTARSSARSPPGAETSAARPT